MPFSDTMICWFFFRIILGSKPFEFISNNNTLLIRDIDIVEQSGVRESGPYKIFQHIIVFPGVTVLSNQCFWDLESLETVNIPLTVIKIDYIFRNNTKLKTIKVDLGNKNYCTDEYGALYNKDKTIIIKIPKVIEYSFPNSVTTISSYSFENLILTNLLISKNIITIEIMAFCNSMITSLTFDEQSSIQVLDDGIFVNSTFNLVVFSKKLKIINSTKNQYLFSNCVFDNIRFPSDSILQEVGYFLFNCIIYSVTFPPSVEIMNYGVFNRCNIQKFNIPKNCISMSSKSVIACKRLSEVTIDEASTKFIGTNSGVIYDGNYTIIYDNITEFHIPKELKSLPKSYFQTNTKIKNIIVDDDSETFSSENLVLYNKNQTKIYAVCGGVIDLQIPSTVENLLPYACESCVSLRKVSFENVVNLISIHNYCFLNCMSLNEVILSPSVISIGPSSFAGTLKLKSLNLEDTSITNIASRSFKMAGLTHVKIPSHTVEIGDEAFYDSNLESVEFMSENQLTTIGASSFGLCPYLRNISLPASVKFVDLTFVKQDSQLLSIYVEAGGDYYDIDGVLYKDDTLVVFPPGRKDAYVDESTTAIGNRSFSFCNRLELVHFGPKVTTICEYAFDNCNSLLFVDLTGSACTLIQEGAFSGCISLKDISFGPETKIIEKYAFYHCYSLQTVYNGKNIERFGESAFTYCKKLHEFSFGPKLKIIPENMFKYCTSLRRVSLTGTSCQTIDSFAFCECISLTTFDGFSQVKAIGSYAFSNCSSLQDILLTNVELIGAFAFEKCSELRRVIFSDFLTTIGINAFADCRLNEVVYCGHDSFNGVVFSNCPSSIAVPISYASESFCSCPVQRILDYDCMFQTQAFTQIMTSTAPVAGSLIVSILARGSLKIRSKRKKKE